jgi:hypothetical protein
MNETIVKLYNSIAKLISLLEYEIEMLLNNSNNKMSDKKQITQLMQQVINLTLQLNKLNHDLKIENNNNDDEDIAIIDSFINKHMKK